MDTQSGQVSIKSKEKDEPPKQFTFDKIFDWK